MVKFHNLWYVIARNFMPSTDKITVEQLEICQLRIQGGFEGFDEPPLAGESLCTTTPPVEKHQN